jgi:hypothetical protein
MIALAESEARGEDSRRGFEDFLMQTAVGAAVATVTPIALPTALPPPSFYM